MWIVEEDGWSDQGVRITDDAMLERFRKVLEEEGPLIVQHWFYRGSRGSEFMIFTVFDELITYMKEKSKPGDAFTLWSFEATCTQALILADGKIPDERGRVPQRGAY
ncbi:hypothetical protein [Corallococcus sp. M7]